MVAALGMRLITPSPRTTLPEFCRAIAALAILVGPLTAFAEEWMESELTHPRHRPNHLSIFLGGTDNSEHSPASTLGIDYERSLSDLLGIGAVIEHAAGAIDATTWLAVTDVHPTPQGLIFQLGIGAETSAEHDVFVARAGVLYEFEHRGFTLSPQLHWDYHDGLENAVVFGLAFGFAF